MPDIVRWIRGNQWRVLVFGAAGVALILVIFTYLRILSSKQSAVSPPAGVSVTPAVSPAAAASLSPSSAVSEARLDEMIAAAINRENYQVEDTGTFRGFGCTGTVNYKAVLHNADQYALHSSVLNRPCLESSLQDAYFETYWVDQSVVTRFRESENFRAVTPESRYALAPDPREQLKRTLLPGAATRIVAAQSQGGSVEVQATRSNPASSGTYTFLVNPAAGEISTVSYTLTMADDATRQPATVSGMLRFTPFSRPVRLPMLQDRAFLLEQFDDLAAYSPVYYWTHFQEGLYYTDNNYNGSFHASSYDGTPKSVFCFPDNPICQRQVREVREQFSALRDLIVSSRGVFCPPVIGRNGLGQDLYQDILEMKLSNDNRNPRETDDYSLQVTFHLREATFSARLKSGKEYCYEGTAQKQGLDALASRARQFLQTAITTDFYPGQ